MGNLASFCLITLGNFIINVQLIMNKTKIIIIIIIINHEQNDDLMINLFYLPIERESSTL